MKSIPSPLPWSTVGEPVASYCGRVAPGGRDVGASPLLYCQGPELTGTGIAAQFCLIGQLKRWWSAVWEKDRHYVNLPWLGGSQVEKLGTVIAFYSQARGEVSLRQVGHWGWRLYQASDLNSG